MEERYAKTLPGPIVDHQYCEIRFTVLSGEALTWNEDVQVPTVPSGNAKVMAHVRLVDPTDCDRYGCYQVLLGATSEKPLLIVGGV